MVMSRFTSVIAVATVKDLDTSMPWYVAVLGEPMGRPMEGIAEWQIAANAWVQVSEEPGRAGGSTVIVNVLDVHAARDEVSAKGVTVTDIADYGVVQVLALTDPDGNQLALVQES